LGKQILFSFWRDLFQPQHYLVALEIPLNGLLTNGIEKSFLALAEFCRTIDINYFIPSSINIKKIKKIFDSLRRSFYIFFIFLL